MNLLLRVFVWMGLYPQPLGAVGETSAATQDEPGESDTTMSSQKPNDFISKLPNTCVNNKKNAASTLDCTDDIWGINGPDSEADDACSQANGWKEVKMYENDPVTGERVAKTDDDGTVLTEWRCIGPSKIEWDKYFVKIRIDRDHAKWYKHLPVAINMYYEKRFKGEKDIVLTDDDINFIKAEGKRYFQEAQKNSSVLPMRLGSRLTRAASVLSDLGVIYQRGGQFILAEDAEKFDAAKAAEAMAKADAVTATADVTAEVASN